MLFKVFKIWLASAALLTTQVVTSQSLGVQLCADVLLDFEAAGIVTGQYKAQAFANLLGDLQGVTIDATAKFLGLTDISLLDDIVGILGLRRRLFLGALTGTLTKVTNTVTDTLDGVTDTVSSTLNTGAITDTIDTVTDTVTDTLNTATSGGSSTTGVAAGTSGTVDALEEIMLDFTGGAFILNELTIDHCNEALLPDVSLTTQTAAGLTTKIIKAAGFQDGTAVFKFAAEAAAFLDVKFNGSGDIRDLKLTQNCEPGSVPAPAPQDPPTPGPKPNAGGGGDPHFRTFDGTSYSYHGECDLVMARSKDFGPDKVNLDLHIRTKSMGTWSLISNAALRIGNDVLEFENDGATYINGHEASFPNVLDGRYTVTNYIETFEQKNEDGGIEMVDRHLVLVDLGGGEEIRMTMVKAMISVRVNAYIADTEGMLGVHGNEGLISRDGTVLKDENAMGEMWQVRDNEAMLFREVRFPQYPAKCIPPAVAGRRLRVSAVERERAEKACASIDDYSRHFCVEDVLLTGDAKVAASYIFGEAF